MLEQSYARRKYTLLVRKLKIDHQLAFIALSEHSGSEKSLRVVSEAIVNQEIVLTTVGPANTQPQITLHIYCMNDGEHIEYGSIVFNMKNEKIMKPLSKDIFAKSFSNNQGVIEYKFISAESFKVNKSELERGETIRNNLIVKTNCRSVAREETGNLMEIINEKDDIISKMDKQIHRLIKETKKLGKSLSKEKEHSLKKYEKNISLNVKVNPSSHILNRKEAYERQIEFLQQQVEKMRQQLDEFQQRELRFLEQIQSLKNKNYQQIELNEEAIKDLRQEIQIKYQKQNDHHQPSRKIFDNMNFLDPKKSQMMMALEEERKKSFVDQQLADHIRKIEEEKERERSRQVEFQVKKKTQKQFEREREKQFGTQRSHSKLLRNRSNDQKVLIKEINILQTQRQTLGNKLAIKDEEIQELSRKLKKIESEVVKLQDENVELRRTKSTLLKQVQGFRFSDKEGLGDIEEYEKMIISERKQIQDEKLKAQIQELKIRNKKNEQELKEKIQQKEMELMKLRLSEKSAVRQKEIYSNRMKQMMENVEGDRKQFLNAIENAGKFQSQHARTRELEAARKDLEQANFRLSKQKSELQNTLKKLRSKLEQQDNEWVRLKSIESQNEYLKYQCEKFEKSNKKFEKQYEAVKQYAQNIELMVGKKPRKTHDDTVNQQRQQKYKDDIRSRLQFLIQEVQEMQNKFYAEQIEIWMAQKSNIIKFYAKKLEEDKKKIMELEEINEEGRKDLIEQKENEINQIKINEINDIDKKITRIKKFTGGQNDNNKLKVEKQLSSSMIQSEFDKLTNKMQKLKEDLSSKNKEISSLNEKIANLIKQNEHQNRKLKDSIDRNKKSLSLLGSEGEFQKKNDQMRKSYYQEIRKNKEMLQSRPYQEFKKMNTDLMRERKNLQMSIHSQKMQFERSRMELNEKIRAGERQNVRKQSQLENLKEKYQKIEAKRTKEYEDYRRIKTQSEKAIRRLTDEVKNLTSSQQKIMKKNMDLMRQLARATQYLQKYENAEDEMFRNQKKFVEQEMQKQKTLQILIREKQQRLLNLQHLKSVQIEKLKSQIANLQTQLEKEVQDNLQAKNLIEDLQNRAFIYDSNLKEKEQAYKFLQQKYDNDLEEALTEKNLLKSQNATIQENIMILAEQIHEKEVENEELCIKLEYSAKRELSFQKIKLEIEQKNKELVADKEGMIKLMEEQNQQYNNLTKAFEEQKNKIREIGDENIELQEKIAEMESLQKQMGEFKHQKQIQILKLQHEKETLAIRIQNLEQKLQQNDRKVQNLEKQKQQLIVKLSQPRSKSEQKSHKSYRSQQHELNPHTSVNLHNKTALAGSTNKIARISSKRSIRHSDSMQKQKLNESRFSREGSSNQSQSYHLNVKTPHDGIKAVMEDQDEMKGTIFVQKKIVNKQKSNIEINVEGSDDEGGQGGTSFIDKKILNQGELAESQSLEMNSVELAQKYQLLLEENEQLKDQINNLQNQNEDLLEQKNGLEEELRTWKNLNSAEQHPRMSMNITQNLMGPQNMDKKGQQDGKLGNSFRRSSSFRSPSMSNGLENSKINRKQSPSFLKEDQQLHQIDTLKREIAEKQLIEQENQQRISELEAELEAASSDNEKMKTVLEELMGELENNNKIYIQQRDKNIKTINQLEIAIQKQLERIDQLLMENVKLQEIVKDLTKCTEKLNNEIKLKDQQIMQGAKRNRKNKQEIQKLKKINEINKLQFRKYEQEAQLQILQLKQKMEETESSVQIKNEQIFDLGERFITVEEQLENTRRQLEREKNQVSEERKVTKMYKQKFDLIQQQMKKYDGNRQGYMERIGELEMEVAHKNQQIKQITKETSISFKKYEITIENQKKDHQKTVRKLRDREEQISHLKLQLAKYNQLCSDQEKEKSLLNTDIKKIQKQLREIMMTYEGQLGQLNKDKQSLKQMVEKSIGAEKGNQQTISTLNKEISKKTLQIKHLNAKVEEKQLQMQKFKDRSRIQLNNLTTQLQVKKDEHQKILIQLERESEGFFARECELMSQIEKAQKKQKDFQEKLIRYEEILEQVQLQIKELKGRPTSDQWQQICFENELFKNRIDELETKIREQGQQQQQRIYTQFRKYKISKQGQLEDLQSEMQKYSLKFQQLQENNYVLKRDNDNMKSQLRNLMQEKMRMQKGLQQYEQDIRDLKEQIEFYKGKRAQDLNKLLNQSYQ